jgi:ribonuclease HII
VTRDRMMCGLHERFPHYGFAAHKGYVTPEHQEALERHGPCVEHRMSYVNVARTVRQDGAVRRVETVERVEIEVGSA